MHDNLVLDFDVDSNSFYTRGLVVTVHSSTGGKPGPSNYDRSKHDAE